MRRLAAPCALLVLAAGCGGSDDGGGGRTVTTAPGTTVTVDAHEYSFDPDGLVVQRAGALTIKLRNEGDLAHNLRVTRDGKEIGGTPSFAPGGTRTARLTLARGKYEFLCTVGDHADLGMQGELEVK
jgi:plastocyanin